MSKANTLNEFQDNILNSLAHVSISIMFLFRSRHHDLYTRLAAVFTCRCCLLPAGLVPSGG